MRYLKDNWPHLLLTILGSAISTAFALGFAWALVGSRIANAERRLDEIEAAHVQETRWQVVQNTANITAIENDQRRTEADVAQINTRLGVIEAKLDAIAETLKNK
ncbi:MAG TPA: hypothetical protein VFE47_19665 [Tepidisphaeraceae bacterium]|jgi:hypothetical protein|nr:hypothetical protein [Tepidisphaeraceae bacterium]